MKVALSIFFTTILVTCLSASAADRRPNIILVMADDQGWEETGYYGHSLLVTPILDEMSKSGLRMDRFYSAAPNCGPTRGSIMTGRHPNRFGLFGPNWAMRPEEIPLAKLIKQKGYSTGHFGKWHLGPVKAGVPNNPGAAGFDEWLSHDNFFEMDPVLVRNGAAPEKIMGESSEIVVDAALDFIGRAVDKEKPFFSVVWFGSPHGPYSGLPRDQALYKGRAPDELVDRYSEITAMDRAIGKLRLSLKEKGISKNTLIWFCSDNGVPGLSVFRPTLKGNKGTLYEGGVRVPSIIEWPAKMPFAKVTTVRAVTTDIFPTICELLKIKLPKELPMDGISLVDLIDGKMKERPTPIAFWKYDSSKEKKGESWLPADLQKGTTPTTKNPGIEFLNYKHPVAKTENFGGEASLLNNEYKLILTKKGETELYDLRQDWSEGTNLAADKPELVESMTLQLREWQASVEQSLAGADYD